MRATIVTSPLESPKTANSFQTVTEYKTDILNLYGPHYLAHHTPEAAAQFILEELAHLFTSTFSVPPSQSDNIATQIQYMRDLDEEGYTAEAFERVTKITTSTQLGNCYEISLTCAQLLKLFGYPYDIEIHTIVEEENQNRKLDHIYLRILGPGASMCIDPTAHTLHEFYKNTLNLPPYYRAYGPMKNFKSIVIPWAHTDKNKHDLNTIKPVVLNEIDSVRSVYCTTVIQDIDDSITVQNSGTVDEQILENDFENFYKTCLENQVNYIINSVQEYENNKYFQSLIAGVPELQKDYKYLNILKQIEEIKITSDINQQLNLSKMLRKNILGFYRKSTEYISRQTYHNLHIINEYKDKLLFLLFNKQDTNLLELYDQLDIPAELIRIEDTTDRIQKRDLSEKLKNRILDFQKENFEGSDINFLCM